MTAVLLEKRAAMRYNDRSTVIIRDLKAVFSRAVPGAEKHGALYRSALLHGIIQKMIYYRGTDYGTF